MPETIHGVTRKDAEGDYNIYINAKLSADERAEAFRHEIKHIQLGHFYEERPVADLEREVDNGDAKEDRVG